MSLLRTAARASVATRAIGATHRRQQRRWAAQDAAQGAPPAPAQEPAPTPDGSTGGSSDVPSMLEQLTKLGELRDAGVLTETEFETQKQRILAG